MNRRKKRRDIILDFTSLLDVIMIILFFFILFSHFEAVEAKSKMEAAQSAADQQTVAAEQREQDAARKIERAEAAEKKAQEAYERLRNESNRSAENFDALQEFERGRNLRLHLTMQNGKWMLFFARGEFCYGIDVDESLAEQFRLIFDSLGYTPETTILCEFSIDASERGSKAAYDAVSEIFAALRKEYGYLYISEFDESKQRRLENEQE